MRPAALAWLAALLLGGTAAAQPPTPDLHAAPQKTETAIVAGGCFWCVQSDFDKLPGVIATEVGYTGGRTDNPSYEQVSEGATGHYEAVRIRFDPARIGFAQLLDYFWRHIDPTNANGQFCDSGPPYRSAIFPVDETQRLAAEASKEALRTSGKIDQVHTAIVAAGPFYRAEEYHQEYYKKNPVRYGFYRALCGRDSRVKALWEGKP